MRLSAAARRVAAVTALAAFVLPAGSGAGPVALAGCDALDKTVVLSEPSFTRGESNTIRWEHVANGCWIGASTDRRFTVRIKNLETSRTSSVTVNGEDEVDATIDAGELPREPNGAIDGVRFQYTVVRKEKICGAYLAGICTTRVTQTSAESLPVSSTQDARSPSGSLQIDRGARFVRALEIPAVVTASDPGGAAASGAGYVEFSASPQFEGCRARNCVDLQPLGGPLTVRLQPGADGPRTVHARVYDRSRRAADDPGTTTIGTPPGNVSPPFHATVLLDRTPPNVVVQISTIRGTVGVPITFDGSQSVDDGGRGADSGLQPISGTWEFGDVPGGIPGFLVLDHTYRAIGTYPIAFSVSDFVGNQVRVALGAVTIVAAPVAPVPQTTSTPSAPTTTPTAADRTAPSLSAVALRRAHGKTSISFRVSERATVHVEVRRLLPRPARRLSALSRRLGAGRRSIVLPRTATRKVGRYLISVVARDAAGNTSRVRTVTLTRR